MPAGFALFGLRLWLQQMFWQTIKPHSGGFTVSNPMNNRNKIYCSCDKDQEIKVNGRGLCKKERREGEEENEERQCRGA